MIVPATTHPVIIFDGECGFCDATVDFILEHDPDGVFRFASRQSPEGKKLLVSHGLPQGGVESVVLVEDGRAHVRSTASLRIARRLRGPWRALYAFSVIPAPLRDAVYGVVSRNRKRSLGERQVCPVPTAERRARFLSGAEV
jgi:predicted DCC family thiol-disulfide oxidoreductase YuxK